MTVLTHLFVSCLFSVHAQAAVGVIGSPVTDVAETWEGGCIMFTEAFMNYEVARLS